MHKPPIALKFILLIFIFGFQFFFFYTYPINIGAYDYPNYLYLIYSGNSNLIHPPGYPLFFRAVLYVFNLLPPSDYLNDPSWLRHLQMTQLMVHFSFLVGIYILIKKRFSEWIALITIFLLGTNLSFIANVNSAAPEWFQGDLALISFSLLLLAEPRFSFKQLTLLIFSALFFSGAYLVKYNTLFLAPAFLCVLMLRQTNILDALRTLIIYSIIFLAPILLFSNTYHYKSTGTTKLSYDHAWVLTYSLPEDYFLRPSDQLGTYALQLIALAATTPSPLDLSHAVAIQNINWGPELSQKEFYEDAYDRIMTMDREDLINYMKTKTLPVGFSEKFAAIPLYYYYGLSKTDVLGMKVYLEALVKDPIYFLARSWYFNQKLVFSPPPAQLFPTLTKTTNYEIKKSNPESYWVSLDYNPSLFSPLFANYYNPSQKLYYPGVKFYDFFSHPFVGKVIALIYFIFNVVVLISIFAFKRNKYWLIYLSILAGISIFAICSTLLLGVRTKEAVFITPFYSLLVALAISIWSYRPSRSKAVN
jgi:hypothetical protein